MPGFIIMCFIMFHRKRVMLVSPPIFREYGDFLKCQKWGVPGTPNHPKLDHTCILALKPMVTLGSLILRNTHIQWFGFPSQCRLTYHELPKKCSHFCPQIRTSRVSRKQHQLNLGFFILWPSKKGNFWQ